MKDDSALEATRRRLLDDRDHVIADINGVAQQVADGEIDEATAAQLLTTSVEELRSVDAELDRLPAPATTTDAAQETPEPTEDLEPVADDTTVADHTSLRRAVTGSLVLLTAITVVIFWIANTPTTEQVPEGAASPIPALEGTDFANVDPGEFADLSIDELADVVDAHPELVAARMLLADSYLEAGENRLALENYLLITAADASAAEESRAQARIGYLAYITEQREAARDFLNRALTLDPANYEAKLFLGMVLLYGFDDAAAAAPLLEEVAALPDLPDEIRSELATALRDAESG